MCKQVYLISLQNIKVPNYNLQNINNRPQIKKMIKIADYQKSHNNQLKSLYEKDHQYLVAYHDKASRYYYPSLVKHRFYQEIISQLQEKKNLKAPQICWLIISKVMLEQNYLVHKGKLKSKYGEKWIQMIDKWLEIQQSTGSTVQRLLQSKKTELRNHFESLNQKATKYDYFNLKQVPAYLISTQWLQKFYDQTYQQRIPPIDNRQLVKLMPFIDTDAKFTHLNYEIKPQMRQNKDYKMISPQSWQFLYKNFNGLQIKRFTTNQKQPTVQIHYRKLNIHLVQDRYFHATNLVLLVPRFLKFNSLLERIKRILIAYNIVPFQSLKRTFQTIKANQLNQTQIFDLIQDDQIDFIEQQDDRFHKITPQLDIEEAKIYSNKQQLIINFLDQKSKDNDLFSKVKNIQTIITRQACLKCGNNAQVFLCICKSVHFCSTQCQKNHKEHIKQCQKIRKQQIQLAKLIKDYNITQRQLQLSPSNISNKGKVGFQNLRNTCYLNSALQCVLRVDKLVQYLTNNDHLKDLNVDNILGSQGHLACAFGQLVKDYYSTHKKRLSPIDVVRIIAKNPQFRGYQHQDSQQFLNYFLDKLHQDLNRVKIKPYTQEIQSNGRPDEIVSAQSWTNYLKRNRSFIQELFTGQYRSQIRCPDCQRISITFDPFMSVTLQFPKQQSSIYVKGFLLNRGGEYEKVQVNVPSSTITRNFLTKTFKQEVVAVTILKKLVKKQWRQDVPVSKNFTDEGIILFYIKQENWQRQINLQFLDEKKQLSAFNRRIYIKNPSSIQELKKQLYSRIRTPLQKAFGKKFETQQQYISYCQQKNILIFSKPLQTQIQFPLSQGPCTLKLQFNPQIKFSQNPKLNYSSSSYDVVSSYFTKDYSKTGISIHEMIQNFGVPQKLTQDNMWYCNVCKQHKMADKIMKIYKLPEYLIMHLKRFNHKNTRYRNLIGVQKIQTTVKLEQRQTINGIDYQLFGVVNHFGSMTFGHYTAYVKKDQWCTYDDQKVKKCSLNGDNAYLVFYKRCQNQRTTKIEPIFIG